MSRWNRSTGNQQTMNNILQTHFNNISLLARSIQSSQEIIDRIQRQNSIDSNRTSNMTNSLFESIFNDQPASHTNTRSSLHRRRHTQTSRTGNVDLHGQNNNNTTTSSNPLQPSSENNQNYHYDNENNVYYFTFDTLDPLVSNHIAPSQSNGVSFETLLITEENKSIINLSDNSSNNADISQNTNHYHLYEIRHFDLIENPINDICPITRERFDSTSEHIFMINNCKHIFNKSALKIWLEQHNTCPCCRGEI